MTLPSSGAISLNDVNVELQQTATGTISLNDANVRSLFGVLSGAISMSDGYGKSNLHLFGTGANGALSISSGTLSSGTYTTASISGSVTCASPTIIYVQNDLTISGTITCRYGQNGTSAMNIVRPAGSDTTSPSSAFTAINADEPAISAAGGTLVSVAYPGGAASGTSTQFVTGKTGSNSATGCGGGGGGGGGGWSGAGGTIGYGGAAGTSYGGGGGGGGGCVSGNGVAGSASNGGRGGNVVAGYNRGGGGGGAGYPTTGAGGANNGGNSGPGLAGENFSGGVIWFIVGGNVTITSSGVINCSGGKGGTPGGGNGGDEGGGGGGGSGGGAIRILYGGTYSNSGTLTCAGGAASTGKNGGNYVSSQGGPGGAGSIATFKVTV